MDTKQKPLENQTIAIIGSGLAGLSSAIEATNLGASVYILEKDSRIGGNSKRASSGINGVYTRAQRRLGIKDSYEAFLKDTLQSGKEDFDPELVDVLVKQSTDAIEFLEKYNVNLDEVMRCGGHSLPRTHRNENKNGKPVNAGLHIIQQLFKELEKREKVKVITNANVIEILSEKNKILGVKYKDEKGDEKTLNADKVILATGGFSADREGLLKQYGPSIADLPTTNGDSASGDGIRLATKLGASLIGMNHIQIHPTGFVNPKDPKSKKVFLAPEMLRGYGCILVNSKGERFANELTTRDALTASIFKYCSCRTEGEPVIAFLIINNDIIHKFGQQTIAFYKSIGLIKEYKNLKELCDGENLPFDKLSQTLEKYNQIAMDNSAQPDEFGKSIFPTTFNINETLHVAQITPSIHYTMGGIRINKNAQVLNEKNEPIEGLFAAGEVTGGVHGKNRLAGNSLLECVVFGRIAGRVNYI